MWYVAQVRTGREAENLRLFQAHVTENGEEAFIPLVERMKKFRGEWVQVRDRLFPGYVFIEADKPIDLYVRLKKVQAVARLLRIWDEIIPLRQDEEDLLRKLLDKERVARYSEGYLEGDRLTVTAGALAGCEGQVKKVLRHKRLVVLEVPLLGRMVEVTLGLGIVEKK